LGVKIPLVATRVVKGLTGCRCEVAAYSPFSRCRDLFRSPLIAIALATSSSGGPGIPIAQSSSAGKQSSNVAAAPSTSNVDCSRPSASSPTASRRTGLSHRSICAKEGRRGASAPATGAGDRSPLSNANGYDLALVLLQTGKLSAAREQATRTLTLKDTGELHTLFSATSRSVAAISGCGGGVYQRAAHMDPTRSNLFDWGKQPGAAARVRAGDAGLHRSDRTPPRNRRGCASAWGIAEYSRGQYEAAVKSFCEAADLAPSDPRP
jgi:hypothetical protein